MLFCEQCLETDRSAPSAVDAFAPLCVGQVECPIYDIPITLDQRQCFDTHNSMAQPFAQESKV